MACWDNSLHSCRSTSTKEAKHCLRFAEMRNEVGLQPLHFAVWGGHQDAAKVLVTYKAKIDCQSSGDSVAEVTCNGGSTPLHIAALR